MLTMEYHGRLWIEIGRTPYVRRDRSKTELIVWACRCAADGCDEVIEAKTPVDNYERSKAFGLKHCALHKQVRGRK